MTRHPEIQSPAARQILTELAQFCATAGRKCYGNFSPEVLHDYLAFHIRQETLAWTRRMQNAECKMQNGEGEITGVGVAWQCQQAAVLQATLAGQHFFDWQATDPNGDALFIADVVATTREASLALVQAFAARCPNWRALPVLTFRRGQLVRMQPIQVLRFFHQQHLKINSNPQD
jgi:hypothetical protein